MSNPHDKAPLENPILPPATIGILGSGQLGRMLAQEARRMGYGVRVFSPRTDTPTGHLSDVEITAAYDDLDAVRDFARQVDVVTYEFENVALETAWACAEIVPVHPGPKALEVAQNRIREKTFMREHGLPVAPFATVNNLTDLHTAVRELRTPAVLKTAESGYDGKGQFKLTDPAQTAAAWAHIKEQPAVLEKFIDFEREISVVVARDQRGRMVEYGPIENDHANHILDVSVCPAQVRPAVAEQAFAHARRIIEKLDVAGVICVEFFLTADDSLLVNEIAPRPHNSGHLTIESHFTSQFGQQLRAVCGLSLGSPRQIAPGAMANLLGDLWPPDGAPPWDTVCTHPDVNLHLYGKREARPGRKMGHLTALADTAAAAKQRVLAARRQITPEHEGR